MIYKNKFISDNFFIVFFVATFFLLMILFFPDKANLENTDISNLTLYEDEIIPYCNNLSFDKSQENKFYNIETIDVEIENLRKYYSNLISIIVSEDKVIKPKYKEVFNAKISFVFLNKSSCVFDAEVRLSGDWTDHIYIKKVIGSLDVKLLDGNVDGITKFKLFLPRTRNHENEIFVATFMEELGFISPRTSFVNLKIDNYQGENIVVRDFIFQEKFSKELIEYYQFREGPLLEIDESFRWEKIIENNFIENNRQYFLPAKVLNKYWARKNIVTEEITIDSIEIFNKSIFNAEKPWTQLNYNYLGDRPEVLFKFDAALMALDSEHAITNHQRKFYFNKIENQFYPIYYDGNSLFLWQSREFEIRADYEDYRGLADAAEKLINTINIDYDSLAKKLADRGLYLSAEEIENYFEIFLNNLNTIKNTTLPNFQQGENYLVNYQPKTNLNLPNTELKLIFYNSNKKMAEVCEIDLLNCTEMKLDFDDYDIFSQNSLLKKYNGVLFGSDKNNYLSITNSEENELVKTLIEDVELINFGKNKVEIDLNNKILNIKIVNPDGRILLIGPGSLSGWSVNLESDLEPSQSEIRTDKNLLTGCLTIYNVEIIQAVLTASQKICEDSINIIRSSGSIEDITVIGAVSDGLDVDFSNLKINNLVVKNSGNDCADFSSGNYNIQKIDLTNCEDKGISIGEKSIIKIGSASIIDSKIGVAIKDSSFLEINGLNGQDNNVCIALYRKKQEFGPSFAKIEYYNCRGDEADYIQKGSELVYGNK